MRNIIAALTIFLVITMGMSATTPVHERPVQSDAIVIDGHVGINEYEYELDRGKYILYYTIKRDTINMAVRAEGTGWVSVGWGGYPDMVNFDMVTGGFDATSNKSYIYDVYSTGQYVPAPDGSQDITEYMAGEEFGWTTLEFSRKLNTGDATGDIEIVPGKSINLNFAFHSTNDDISIIHTWVDHRYYFRFFGPPASPQNLHSTNTLTNVSLFWFTPLGNGGDLIKNYSIYRSEDGGQSYSWISNTTNLYYLDEDVVPGTIFKYKVTALNAKGESGYSNIETVLPIGNITEPVSVTAYSLPSQVNLTWNEPLDSGGIPVKSYNIYRSTDYGTTYTFHAENTTSRGFIDTDVVNGYVYYYRVTALNQYNESAFSEEVSASPVGEPSIPVNITGINGNNYVVLTWDRPFTDGGFPVLRYNIYRSDTPDGNYTFIGSNTSTFGFTDLTALNGETYYYIVKAENIYGESLPSLEQMVTVANTPMPPRVIGTTVGNQTVTIEWEHADGRGFNISYYTVYRMAEGESRFTMLATTNLTSYTDTGLDNGKEYVYQISATSEIGESPYSTPIYTTPAIPPGPPAEVKVRVANNTAVLTWDKPLYDGGQPVLGYTIYRSENNNDSYSIIGSSYSRFFEDSDLNYSSSYHYKVAAFNAMGEGAASADVSVVPIDAPDVPIRLSAVYDKSEILLTWEVTDDSTEFTLYRSRVQGGPYTKIGSTNTTSFRDRDIAVAEHYYYVVTAANSAGESGYSSEAIVSTFTHPAVPSDVVLFASQDSISIVWLPGEGHFMPADYFRIHRSLDNVTFEVVGNTTELYYIDDDVEINTTYYYYVVAVNEVGESLESEVVYGTPQSAEVTISQGAEDESSATPLSYTEDLDMDTILATSGIFLMVGGGALVLVIIRKAIAL